MVDFLNILRILVAGLVLGIVVGKLVAERPYHLNRILPRRWTKVARKMRRKEWVRVIGIGLWVAALSLIITTVVSAAFAQARIEVQNPAENPLSELQATSPLVLLVLVNVLPIFEEWVFRGILMDEIIRWKRSNLLAIVLSSVVFAAFHLSNPGTYPAFAVVLFPSSLLLGLCYLKTGLGGAILAHNSYNTFLVIIEMII